MAQQAFFQLVVAAAAVLLLTGCANMQMQSAGISNSLNPMGGDGQLVGATAATLSSAFGPPALRRIDGTAQVWLYHSPVCGLDLILYPDRTGTPRVAAAVPDNGNPAACTASLRRNLTDAALEPDASS